MEIWTLREPTSKFTGVYVHFQSLGTGMTLFAKFMYRPEFYSSSFMQAIFQENLLDAILVNIAA